MRAKAEGVLLKCLVECSVIEMVMAISREAIVISSDSESGSTDGSASEAEMFSVKRSRYVN